VEVGASCDVNEQVKTIECCGLVDSRAARFKGTQRLKAHMYFCSTVGQGSTWVRVVGVRTWLHPHVHTTQSLGPVHVCRGLEFGVVRAQSPQRLTPRFTVLLAPCTITRCVDVEPADGRSRGTCRARGPGVVREGRGAVGCAQGAKSIAGTWNLEKTRKFATLEVDFEKRETGINPLPLSPLPPTAVAQTHSQAHRSTPRPPFDSHKRNQRAVKGLLDDRSKERRGGVRSCNGRLQAVSSPRA
jgi:hypothetical protein